MPTVLITGAGRGLGFEFARQYAGDGWTVIGTVRAEKAVARLKSAIPGVEAHVADIASVDSIRALAAKLRGVPVDVLICNAGVRGRLDLAVGTLDYAEWESVFRVNVLGAAATAEALIANVASSERKVIVMMSSRLGSIAESPGKEIAYASSKAALNAVMRILALQLEERSITVVSVSPGWVRTGMGGKGAPLSPEESVGSLRKVIGSLKREDSGRFYSLEKQDIPF
jgi:NAD(P)-dependent dehydrogenase (short-subunit alcohol dehydrogenase family)